MGVLLNQASSVGNLMQFAMASAASNPDPSVRDSLSPGLHIHILRFIKAAYTAQTTNHIALSFYGAEKMIRT